VRNSLTGEKKLKAIPPKCPVTVIRKDNVGAIVVYICPNCHMETLESDLIEDDETETVYWILKCNRCGGKWIFAYARGRLIPWLKEDYDQYQKLKEILLSQNLGG